MTIHHDDGIRKCREMQAQLAELDQQDNLPLYSELEARTRATAWEDRLLRANVLTSNGVVDMDFDYIHRVAEEGRKAGDTPQAFYQGMRLFGAKLREWNWGYDDAHSHFAESCKTLGIGDQNTPERIGIELLLGIDDSCKVDGIPTTHGTSA